MKLSDGEIIYNENGIFQKCPLCSTLIPKVISEVEVKGKVIKDITVSYIPDLSKVITSLQKKLMVSQCDICLSII